jgi:hypothetical protein
MIQRERAFACEAAIAAERQVVEFETATHDRNSKSEAGLVQQMNRMMDEERSKWGECSRMSFRTCAKLTMKSLPGELTK